jgi:hypothetical protein
MSRAFCALLPLLAGVVASPGARAEDYSPLAACPAGNLLAGRRPTSWQDTRRDLALLTDEAVAPEGATWDAPPAVLFDTSASTVTWDLGAATTVSALAIQADANDTYTAWGSLDGRDYRVLGHINPVPNHGLRMRTIETGGAALRYLRVGEGVGDNSYSISEVAAYCQKPTPFPAHMRVVDAPPAVVAKVYWDDIASARWELVLALLGLLFLWWDQWVSKGAAIEPKEKAPGIVDSLVRFVQNAATALGLSRVRGRVRRAILAVLGLVAFLTYFNFGSFHFPNFIHGWDTFHYYIGSKYSRELSYDRLYECVAVADSELPTLRRRVELRKLTNLRTNILETTADILAHPERCKQHFTPERWQSFHNDLAYFRTLENARRWDDAQTDHGFNGTPVWNIAGSLLANLAPASKTQIYILNALDSVYLTAGCLMIAWAFGWRVLAVALLVFATNFPSRFYWTGGAFLRWDWLFWMIASACLLKKQHPVLAGLALAYSTLLRIFPIFLFVAPVLAAGYHLIRHRKLHPTYLRFFAGAALGAALLIPAGMAVVGRADTYQNFVRNTMKHSGTALTNNMGLRTVVAYRPSEAGRMMRSEGQTDPWVKWKQARLDSFRRSKAVYFAAVVAFLVLLGLAVREAEPWAALALSATFIPFGVELTCYYYSFIIVVALLCVKSERLALRLLLLTAFTQFVAWAPLKGMPTWLDEQYTLMSVATLIVFIAIAWEFFTQRRLALAGPVAVAFGSDGPEEDATAREESAHVAQGSRGRGRGRHRRR